MGTHTGFPHPSWLGSTGTPVSPVVEYKCRNISPSHSLRSSPPRSAYSVFCTQMQVANGQQLGRARPALDRAENWLFLSASLFSFS